MESILSEIHQVRNSWSEDLKNPPFLSLVLIWSHDKAMSACIFKHEASYQMGKGPFHLFIRPSQKKMPFLCKNIQKRSRNVNLLLSAQKIVSSYHDPVSRLKLPY